MITITDCPLTEKCAFFNDQMADMPATSRIFKKKYCAGDFEKCARYQVKQATGVAHKTLMPNQEDKVEQTIADIKAAQ